MTDSLPFGLEAAPSLLPASERLSHRPKPFAPMGITPKPVHLAQTAHTSTNAQTRPLFFIPLLLAQGGMILRRIPIRNYKSLVRLEVTLDSLIVVFGPSGAGKSNFLDALQALSREATSRTLKDALEPPDRGTPLESFTFGSRGSLARLWTARVGRSCHR